MSVAASQRLLRMRFHWPLDFAGGIEEKDWRAKD
jgi:hypothetical protein